MKILYSLSVSLLLTTFLSCQEESFCECADKDAIINNIDAKFDGTTQQTIPATYKFNSSTKNAKEFEWSVFENRTNLTKVFANSEISTYTFNQSGKYRITLKVNGKQGGSSDSKFIDITVRNINEELRNGLISQYNFDGNYNGTIGGIAKPEFNVSFTTNRLGEQNKALKFGGYDTPGRVRIPNFYLSDAFTISFWFKIDDYAGMQRGTLAKVAEGVNCLFTKDVDAISIGNNLYKAYMWGNIQGGNLNGVEYNFATSVIGTPINQPDNTYVPISYKQSGSNLNKWYHLTYSASKKSGLKLYINGSLVTQKTGVAVNFTFPNEKDLFLGGYGVNTPSGKPYHPFNGAIDDLYIFNRELTDEEVIYMSK